jgi:sulfhydrogenase subunit beta (sulfur reductase)
MKETGFLPKGKEKEFLEALGRKALVFAPCREESTVVFRPFDREKALCLDRPANIPPKGIIFQQNETLFSFEYKKSEDDPQKTEIDLKVTMDVPETIIFGVRPCDAKGFKIIDRVYLDTDTPDPYYKARREKTTIVTLSCPSPSTGCFCVATGGGPANAEGSDVMMTLLEEGYYMEAVSDKGRVILEEPLLLDGGPHGTEAKKKQDAVEGEVMRPFSKDGPPKPSMALFNLDSFWKSVTEQCLSCGACTFLCPTCYCFNITDEKGMSKGERVRNWDACMFSHFTLEASGHNPRPLKENRFRNRVGHKFVYYPERYDGVIACCGCGRCIRYCPVSIDISKVVSDLAEGPADVEKTNVKTEEA